MAKNQNTKQGISMQVTFILEFKLFVSEKYDFFKNKYAPILSPT